VQAPICANDTTCQQLWGTDACKHDVRCDVATATCTYDLLDQDEDQHAPLVCGGDDCDDSDPQRNPAMVETCDGKDNDCDGDVDENVACPGLLACVGGACVCPPANACGSECVDKNTNVDHCGACYNQCPGVASCVAGVCECPAPAVACGLVCVNTQTDPNHCGGCDQQCAAGYSCSNGTCTCLHTSCAGQCVDTQTDASNCGGCGQVCPATATCQNGACLCPAGTPTECGGTCVDLSTNNEHCGSCDNACGFGQCQGGQCPTCAPGGLLLLLDRSGSMSSNCGSQTCVQAELSAVETFVQDTESEGLSVGVTYFPRPPNGNALCTIADYAQPDVAIDLLPGNASPIVNSGIGSMANGLSVVVGALGGGIEAASGWAAGHAGPGAVVMINDGGMGIGCNTETVAQAVATASAGFAGTPSIRTFVIGVNPGGYAIDTQWWNEVPAAGGGTLTNTGNLGAAAILDALRTIRAEFTCP